MARLDKVRCFVIDDTTGEPRGGVAVSLTADGDSGPRVLGLLVSDRAGYLAFDLSNTGLAAGETALWLTPLGEPKSRLEVMAQPSGTSAAAGASATHVDGRPDAHSSAPPSTSSPSPLCFPFLLRVKSASATTSGQDGCGTAVLPAVQSPDPCDYRLSPGSFVTSVSKLLGEGCCESLVPSTLPVQEYVFRRVITRGPSPAVPSGAAASKAKTGPIDVTMPPKAEVNAIAFGEVLQFRQEWFGLGHALGEIRYSLALAPGESKEIAVVDWSRQDEASRTDAITSTEYLANQLNRDRSIGETVNSMLSEQQFGFSGMIGTAGAGSYSGGQYNAAADNSMGNAIGYSSGQRNLEADSLQALHDSTDQTTAVVRTLNSTVVMQSSQAEQNVLQTRRVANHNHCHALTIEYYEVLRHYLMRTAFDGRRPAILIPFQPFDFTPALAMRFRTLLAPGLLDTSLAGDFDAILRYNLGTDLYDQDQAKASTAPQYFTGTKVVVVDGRTPTSAATFGVGLIQKGSRIQTVAPGNVTQAIKFDPTDPKNYDADGVAANADQQYYAPGKRQLSLVCRLSSTWYQGGTNQEFVSDADDDYLLLQPNDVIGKLGDNSGAWIVNVTVTAPAPSASPPAPPANSFGDANAGAPTKAGDAYAQAVLLQHLNGNRGYYNRVVWLGIDESDRRLYIDDALAPFPGLAAAVDSTPLACSGNVVAFGYQGQVPNWSETRPEDPTEPIESIVTLPTRGVFAEAMLGHCNACEVRDVTRMWDWTEATVEEPPPIQDVAPGPRGTPEAVTPTTLPQAVVQISQPPAAPDPVGLAAALRVMGTPNIFRDMSGLQELSSLLDTLTNGAVTSLAGAQKVGQQAQQKIQSMQSQQGQSGGATTGAGQSSGSSQTRTQPNDANPSSQVDKLRVIDQAKQSGLITPQQATQATLGVIGGEILPVMSTLKNIQSPLGIDVSQFQGLIDWDKVAATSNYYFAFIRASRGTTADTRFQTNWVSARATSLMCGAYHFWLPQIAGATQAQTFITQLGPLARGDLPPVIDVEDSQFSHFAGLDQAALEANIQEFMDAIKNEYGVYPIIYTGAPFWNDPQRMAGSTMFSSYLLWIANWQPKNDPTLPGGWPAWDFWQMTDSGRSDGINGVVDVSMYSGTLQQLQIMAGLNPTVTQVPPGGGA